MIEKKKQKIQEIEKKSDKFDSEKFEKSNIIKKELTLDNLDNFIDKSELASLFTELTNIKSEFLILKEKVKKTKMNSERTENNNDRLVFSYQNEKLLVDNNRFYTRSFLVKARISEMFAILTKRESLKQQDCINQALYDFVYRYISTKKINEYLAKVKNSGVVISLYCSFYLKKLKGLNYLSS